MALPRPLPYGFGFHHLLESCRHSIALFNRTPGIKIMIPQMEIWFGQYFWCSLLSGLDMKECGDIKQIIKANAQLFRWLKNACNILWLVECFWVGAIKTLSQKKRSVYVAMPKMFQHLTSFVVGLPRKKRAWMTLQQWSLLCRPPQILTCIKVLELFPALLRLHESRVVFIRLKFTHSS